MKGSSLGYLLKTGFKNVYMNRLMSFASIGVLVACLMLIGSAVLLSLNMQVIVGAVEDENEMVAFLDMDVSDDQARQVAHHAEGCAAADAVGHAGLAVAVQAVVGVHAAADGAVGLAVGSGQAEDFHLCDFHA